MHPIGEPGYLHRHVLPNVARGASEMGRSVDDVSIIVPVNLIVGDTDADREADRQVMRTMLSFYGSTPNYAFIWDEAGFDGTTARVREHQKAGDMAGMAAQITDDHLGTFCTEATWDGLAQALVDKYGDVASRLVLYNAMMGDPDRIERFGEVAKQIRFLTESPAE